MAGVEGDDRQKLGVDGSQGLENQSSQNHRTGKIPRSIKQRHRTLLQILNPVRIAHMGVSWQGPFE